MSWAILLKWSLQVLCRKVEIVGGARLEAYPESQCADFSLVLFCQSLITDRTMQGRCTRLQIECSRIESFQVIAIHFHTF